MQVIKLTLECPDSWDGEPATLTVQVSRDADDEVPAKAIGTLLMKAFKESGLLTCGWPDAFAEAVIQSAEHEEDFESISDKYAALVEACKAYREDRRGS